MRHPQLNRHGELTHLLTTEGLSRALLMRLLDRIETLMPQATQSLDPSICLQGKKVSLHFLVNLCEDDRLTQQRFVRAAEQMSAEVQKGDVWRDCDILVTRHASSGAPFELAQHLPSHVHLINAGDGCHADPTQALFNAYVIRQIKKDFSNLTIVIVGDVLHSREARSTIHALTTLGVPEVRVVGPHTLMPEGLAQFGVRAFTKLSDGLSKADVLIVLPPPQAAVVGTHIPSLREFELAYAISKEKLSCAQTDCLVLTPHAVSHMMVDRESTHLAVNMAVMSLLAGASS